MKNNKDIDMLLKQALHSNEVPGQAIIQKIKQITKEDTIKMKTKKVKLSFSAAVAAVMVFVLVSATAFAAWYFLKPSDIAKEFENHALSAAFESDTAININESITSGGYTVTLLSVVSGSDITDMPYYNSDEIQADRTYAVIAIQSIDGTAMTYDDEFFASPLIKGMEPMARNVIGMNGGGYSSVVIDGILYRITECDNVEMFADRGLYFAVCSGVFFNSDAFIYNESTGEITSNSNFMGTSAIFDLPLNVNLADSAKAQQYLNDREASAEPEYNDRSVLFGDIDWDTAAPVDSTARTLTVDADLSITYAFEFEHGSGEVTVLYSEVFNDTDTPQTAIAAMMASDDIVYAVRMTRDAYGVITGVIVM